MMSEPHRQGVVLECPRQSPLPEGLQDVLQLHCQGKDLCHGQITGQGASYLRVTRTPEPMCSPRVHAVSIRCSYPTSVLLRCP